MQKLKQFVENPLFQNFITALIILTGIFLGMETSRQFAGLKPVLIGLEQIIIWIFIVEIVLKFIVYRFDFFKDPWRIFDLIIMITVVVSDSDIAPIFRILRLLRVIDRVSIFRRIIETIFRSIPSIAGLVLLEILLIYVYAIIGVTYFSDTTPELFGSLGTACFTMFQVVTGEGWNEVAEPVMAVEPMAGVFFITFLLFGSFLLLNMFVSIMVSAAEDFTKEETEKKQKLLQKEKDDRYALMLQEIKNELKAEIGEVKAMLAEKNN